MLKSEFKANRATEAVRNAIAQLEDMTPVYQDIVEHMLDATRRRFAQEVAPDGTKWPAKRPATLDRYRAMGYGTLDRVLQGPTKRLSREIVGQATNSGAVIGSALIYSRVMQEGAAKGAFGTDRHGRFIPWGRIPARTWLGLSADDERKIVEIVDEHLGEQLESKAP